MKCKSPTNLHANVKLSRETLDSLTINEIIYAEFAHPDGMGNSGSFILYVMNGDKLIRYEGNIYKNKDIYNDVVNILKNNRIVLSDNTINKNGIFTYYYAGLHNHVFLNARMQLKIDDRWFVYTKSNVKYGICTSLCRVFESVASAWRAFKFHFDRGNEYCHKKDWINAITEYTKALKVDPGDYFALYNRGRTYMDCHKYEEAIIDLEKTLLFEEDEEIIDLINGAKMKISENTK